MSSDVFLFQGCILRLFRSRAVCEMLAVCTSGLLQIAVTLFQGLDPG